MDSIFRKVMLAAYTLFLFMKSDIVTTLIPNVIFSASVAPLCPINPGRHLFTSVTWIVFHLLQNQLFNQTTGADEDRRNKPWRPIPSGLISLRHAIFCRWLSLFGCVVYSGAQGGQLALTSVFFSACCLLYNLTGAHRHWFSRNALNGLGIGGLLWGGVLLAGCDPSSMDKTNKRILILNVLIISSTIQAQDFRDVDGDRVAGRKTLQIMHPRSARLIQLLLMLAWSVALGILWQLPQSFQFAFAALGLFAGAHFLLAKNPTQDQFAYSLYGVWLMAIFVFSGFYRLNSNYQNYPFYSI